MGPRPDTQQEVVVLDTNILISALGWSGPERRIYGRCRAGRLQLAISPALLNELTRVMRYPKLNFSEEEIGGFLHDLVAHAKIVHPVERIDAVRKDPDDDRLLECGLAAGANCLVTGDQHLLDLGAYGGIPILTSIQALSRLELD